MSSWRRCLRLCRVARSVIRPPEQGMRRQGVCREAKGPPLSRKTPPAEANRWHRPCDLANRGETRRSRMALPEEPVSRTPRAFEYVQMSVRWPGVWAGLLIAMGVLVILTALGLAVGATAVGNNGATQALGRGAAWWGGISFLIALFIGGAVSARWVAGALTSVLQGALVWVLAIVAVLYLAGAGISLGAQGLFAAMGSPALNQAMEQMA